jgi:hypothetical protein
MLILTHFKKKKIYMILLCTPKDAPTINYNHEIKEVLFSHLCSRITKKQKSSF